MDTSNRVVQDWGKYLADATMATTILDRLMHRCTMLEFEGKSYRLKAFHYTQVFLFIDQ